MKRRPLRPHLAKGISNVKRHTYFLPFFLLLPFCYPVLTLSLIWHSLSGYSFSHSRIRHSRSSSQVTSEYLQFICWLVLPYLSWFSSSSYVQFKIYVTLLMFDLAFAPSGLSCKSHSFNIYSILRVLRLRRHIRCHTAISRPPFRRRRSTGRIANHCRALRLSCTTINCFY